MDASFFENEGKTGFGVCLRNDRGDFMLAKTAWIPFLPSVKEGKDTGLLKALQWISLLGLSKVVFELDSKTVVDNVNGLCDDIAEFGALIHSFCDLLSNITGCSLSFTRPHANGMSILLLVLL